MQQNDLRTIFHIIMEIPDSWDNNTLMISGGCQKHQHAFFFFLIVYDRTFNETGRLFQVMNVEYCLAYIRNTVAAL